MIHVIENFQFIYLLTHYLAEPITDADYADDIALPANTPTQAKSLLHNLE